MSLLPVARRAVTYSRKKIWAGSSIKNYRSFQTFTAEKAYAKSVKYSPEGNSYRYEQLKTLRRDGVDKLYTSDEILQRADEVESLVVGDSAEHAAVTYKFLLPFSRNQHFQLDLVRLKFFDLYFVVLGQQQPPTRTYSMNFLEWDEQAVVCCSFSTTACPARAFPFYWRGKMKQWHDRGMVLNGQSPTSSRWLDWLVRHNKVSALAPPIQLQAGARSGAFLGIPITY